MRNRIREHFGVLLFFARMPVIHKKLKVKKRKYWYNVEYEIGYRVAENRRSWKWRRNQSTSVSF